MKKDLTNDSELKMSVHKTLGQLCLEHRVDSRGPNFSINVLKQRVNFWTIQVQADVHASLGTNRVTHTVVHRVLYAKHDEREQENLAAVLTPMIIERSRIERRARAMRDAGQVNPDWAFNTDECVAHMLQFYKVDFAHSLQATHEARSLAFSGSQDMPDLPNSWNAQLTLTCDRAGPTRITVKATVCADNIVTSNLFITDADGKSVLRYTTTPDRCAFTLDGLVLPEVTLQTIHGQPLSSVIGHPALAGVEAPILHVKNCEPTPGKPQPWVEIMIDRNIIPLAAAPEDVDVGWRKKPNVHEL